MEAQSGNLPELEHSGKSFELCRECRGGASPFGSLRPLGSEAGRAEERLGNWSGLSRGAGVVEGRGSGGAGPEPWTAQAP